MVSFNLLRDIVFSVLSVMALQKDKSRMHKLVMHCKRIPSVKSRTDGIERRHRDLSVEFTGKDSKLKS